MFLPTLKQLRYLTALDEHKHFGRAAGACFVSQSTLSAGLQELETLLGASLVERSNRSVVFTALGREIAARARVVLREAQELAELAAASKEPLSGTLRLGVIPTIGPFLLPKVLPKLRKAYPKLKLYLTEDLTQRLVDELHAGALDCVLLALPVEIGEAEAMILFDDPFALVCRKDNALAAKTRLSTGDVAEAPLLLLTDGHCLRDHALDACHLGRRPQGTDVAATSLHTLVEMAANGLGVTLIPKMALEAKLLKGSELVARPFAGGKPGRRVGLIWRKTSAREGEFRLLGEAIKAAHH
ncbi:MAG TPA: hydrogen peroxide-inducible genes activator [Candidatus Cybelea sp.]|nr:hydrogen peroxide-inducible genes activator [Candidatus Cybelea sp.]